MKVSGRTSLRVAGLAGVALLMLTSTAVEAQPAPPPEPSTSTPAPPPVTSPPVVVDDPFGPTPTTTPPPSPDTSPPEADRPGFFDVGGRIRKAVDDWFRSLVTDALEPVLNLVGSTVLSTPDFTGPGRVRDLWFVSWGMANAVFVLFVLGAGALGMGYETLQTRYAVKELLPRIVVGWVVANASLVLARVAIGFANSLTAAFVDQGLGVEGAAETMKQLVVASLAGGQGFVALISLAVLVLGLCLVGVYVVRVCTLVVLVAGAPLFLVAHALPQTEGAARLWWRALAGCLGVQVGQALVLVTALRVFFDADGRRLVGIPGGPLMDLLVVGCLFWLLLRIPTMARKLVFNTRPNAALGIVRYYVVGKGLRRAGKAVAAAAA